MLACARIAFEGPRKMLAFGARQVVLGQTGNRLEERRTGTES